MVGSVLRSPIVIVGAGLVGAAQALALAKHDIPSVIIDKAQPDDVLKGAQDGRVSAISYASQHVLRYIDVWDQLAQDAGAIEKILVTENGRFSDILFDAQEEGDEPFGHMIPNLLLRRVLLQSVLDHPLVTVLSGDVIASLEREALVHVVTASGQAIDADLLVVADGRYSNVRDMVGVKARRFEYGQSAIVCTVKHEKPHEQTAVEWFFPVGPLALLPMHGGQHSCIVWTETSDMAAHFMQLDDAEFIEELQLKLGKQYGALTLQGRRYSYPLNLFQAESYIAERAAVIGDAAHAIHPIAGQGVNLGYRDVAVLTELLVDAVRAGQDIGAASMLEHYQRWRRFDATSMIATTDGLNRLFSNHSPIIRAVRRAGMAAFQRSGAVKSFFMQSAMGMSGDLPKILQGEVL